MARKLKKGSAAWKKALIATVFSSCPPLINCRKCGHPTQMDYVCSCGCADPGDDEIDLYSWQGELA